MHRRIPHRRLSRALFAAASLIATLSLLYPSATHAARPEGSEVETPKAVVGPSSQEAAAEVAAVPPPAPAPDRELERRVNILTEEVADLRERLVIPEKEVYKSAYGMGPAASKIYRLQQGVSIGGYGEFYGSKRINRTAATDVSIADFYRYVQYVGYKFNEKFLVNAEIEIEHSNIGANFRGQGGSVSLEFAYLDYLAHPALNLRAGLLLTPMGFVNEIHEPPFYHGNFRPELERQIIPSTWSELGLGAFGEPLPGLSYRVYAISGLRAEAFEDSGWRDGRQKGGRALARDLAGVARVDYDWWGNGVLQTGGSLYYGGADQGRVQDPSGEAVAVNALLVEGHLQLRYRGIELRGLVAFGALSNADILSANVYDDGTKAIASQVFGWYGEAAYDLWRHIGPGLYLAPYVRIEQFDTQFEVPGALAADNTLDRTIIQAGLTFKPHPQIVLKFDYRDHSNAADLPASDVFYLGAGFMY